MIIGFCGVIFFPSSLASLGILGRSIERCLGVWIILQKSNKDRIE